MTEGRTVKPVPEMYAYWAADRANQGRTLESPYQELRGDSIAQRRQIQIDNLTFKLEHAAELGIWDRKIERMQEELARVRLAQEVPSYSKRYATRNYGNPL